MIYLGKDTLIVKDDVIKYLGNMYNDLKRLDRMPKSK